MAPSTRRLEIKAQATTIEFPNDAFTRLGGGALYRVGLTQRMDTMYNADPNLGVLGPFGNFDAGTELVQSRNIVPIPHRYTRHFIRGPLTPRQFWEALGQDIISNQDGGPCAPIMNLFRVACTLNVVGDPASPVAQGPLVVPLADATLLRHRKELIKHKLPGLNRTPIMVSGQQVATSLGELVQEQCAARAELNARQAQSGIKTLEDYFGTRLQVLLCLCQVATPAELPLVYQACADNGKKKERTTMQRATDDMMHQMGLADLQFVITTDLVAKVSSFSWKALPEDLSQGIHPFSVGEVNPDAIVALQGLARTYDFISSYGAAPSLSDAQSLVRGGKVTIAKSLIALDLSNYLFLAFLNVFLGTNHQGTLAWTRLTQEMSKRMITLQFYTLRTPRHQLLLPALSQRWAQLRWSYWVGQQWNSMNNVPAPNYLDLWRCLTLKTDWESPLPERYMAELPALTPPRMPPLPPLQPGRMHTPAAPPPAAGTDPQAGTAVRCLPYNEVFTPYRQTGDRERDDIRRAAAAGQTVPQSDAGQPMCISYHVKGICNSRCGRSAGHTAHNAAESARLSAWCASAFVADP
jgi:hypothetical protein